MRSVWGRCRGRNNYLLVIKDLPGTFRCRSVSLQRMKLSVKEWIGMWHACYPMLFKVYVIVIVPTMFVCTRRLRSKHSTLAGLILSAVSFVVVMRFPIGAVVWMIIEGLTLGEQAQFSLFNGFSFAPLMALCGAFSGAVILRLIFRERIGKKGFALLYIGNLLTTVFAIAVVLTWISIYPPQFIA